MKNESKTWRTPVAGILLFIAAVSIFTGAQNIIAGKLPPPGPERHGFLVGMFGVAILFAIPGFILYAKEKSRRRP